MTPKIKDDIGNWEINEALTTVLNNNGKYTKELIFSYSGVVRKIATVVGISMSTLFFNGKCFKVSYTL